MKALGNGKPEVCASNLLRIMRGEIPYDRVRGRDSTFIDEPNSENDAAADAEWVLETFEPRVKVNSIEIDITGQSEGDFTLIADISQKEDDDG